MHAERADSPNTPQTELPMTQEQLIAQGVVLDYLEARIRKLKGGSISSHVFGSRRRKKEDLQLEIETCERMRTEAAGFNYLLFATQIPDIVSGRILTAVDESKLPGISSRGVNALQDANAFAVAYRDSGIEEVPGRLQQLVHGKSTELGFTSAIFGINRRLANKVR